MFRHPDTRRLTGDIADFLSAPRFPAGEPPDQDPAWPRITIVTPSFNQAPFLERTLRSIHNQGYRNLEHIVIDGGSTDGSVEIIRRYENRLHYWHSRPDRGHCDAINTGAARATGRFMTWINSDDILLPDALRRVGEAIRSYGEADIIYGNQVEIDDRDRVTKRVYTIDFDIRDFIYETNIILLQQSTFWRTALFQAVDGVSECRYAMDYELFYRMFRAGANMQRIDGFLSGFRVYSHSLTGSGEVGRSRGPTLDGIFEDFTGRKRNLFDRTLAYWWFKAGRFLSEPRALVAAAEHRIGRLLTGDGSGR